MLGFFYSIYLFLVSTGTFDLQVYTVTDCEVPQEWDETQPCFIANAQEMPLRTFSTSLHRVETHVSYKAEWTGMVYECSHCKNLFYLCVYGFMDKPNNNLAEDRLCLY